MKYRRGMFRLNSNHSRELTRFAKFFVFGISGGISGKIFGVPEWKNVDIRYIREFIDRFERSSFLYSDPVGVSCVHDCAHGDVSLCPNGWDGVREISRD